MRHACRRSWCDPRSPGGLPCGFPERSRTSSLHPGVAKALNERALAVHFGVLFAQQHLLQRKHALRALQVVELQAPVDRFEQLPGILAVPHFRRGDVAVLLGAVVGRLGRRAGKAGENARADGVAIAPGPEQVAVLVLLRRREAGRIHRVQARALLGERLAGGAEIDEHGRAVVADIDVGGLDVQMKELVRVHLPQPVQQQREHVADESFLDRPAARADVFLQRAPALVAHHHVDGLVCAKEIQHPHHVRMRQSRERAAFLEEAPHAVAKRRQVFLRNRGQRVALFSQRELAREVFLDRDRLVVFVVGEIDDGKTPAGEHARDAVVFELIAVRQRLIGLLWHQRGSGAAFVTVIIAAFSIAAGIIRRHSSQSMITSMTGYAAATRELPTASLAAEVKSVNGRFLDVQLRLPEELRSVEPALRELIQARVGRGKVEIRVSVTPPTGAAPQISVNEGLLAALAETSRKVRAAIPDAQPLSVGEVLHWPGVLGDDRSAALREACVALVQELLEDFTATRSREGAKLAAMLIERAERMKSLLASIQPKLPEAIAAYEEKLSARLREVLGDANEERIRQEIALFGVKADVAEELNRLGAHLEEVH